MRGRGILQFIRDQYQVLPETKADLNGKVVIVTGANAGLGLEAARHLARMNPTKLILACRDPKKGLEALESIVKNTNCATIECWMLDLASFESIKAFAERFDREGGGKLDLLIENAGLGAFTYTKSKDGYETCLAVNHLGTCHLAFRLLPYLLKASVSPPTPRLVIVGSFTHYWIDDLEEASTPKLIEQLASEEHCKKPGVMGPGGTQYPMSKTLNIFFTRALAARLPATSPLTVNCVDPGFCITTFNRDAAAILAFVVWLAGKVLGRSTEVGSRTLVHAALSPDLQGLTGEFLNGYDVNEPSDLVVSEKGKVLQERIWNETVEILSQADPKVEDVVKAYLS